VDDGIASVQLAGAPLLGVLPGTGGLTRVSTSARCGAIWRTCSARSRGVRGKRAVEWRLVDKVWPASQFKDAVAKRAQELAGASDRPADWPRCCAWVRSTPPWTATRSATRTCRATIDRAKRVVRATIAAPETPQPATGEALMAAGDEAWALRAFRELDDAILRLRLNEPEIGTLLLRATGDPQAVLDVDAALHGDADHWLVREIVGHIRRTLKRVDLTARSLFALIEPGNAFAGTLFELALASDRIYMLDHPDEPNTIQLSAMNAGAYPMSTGLSRLQVRFLGEPDTVGRGARARRSVHGAGSARGGPRFLRARRHRLGRRSSSGD
jgi:benzoyl-CoA-dihydrodiol lyase